MSKWNTDGQRFWKDMVIVFFHPDFRDQPPMQAYRELKQQRGEYV